jgi:hypothetical protein
VACLTNLIIQPNSDISPTGFLLSCVRLSTDRKYQYDMRDSSCGILLGSDPKCFSFYITYDLSDRQKMVSQNSAPIHKQWFSWTWFAS